jgi:hypothetical protein
MKRIIFAFLVLIGVIASYLLVRGPSQKKARELHTEMQNDVQLETDSVLISRTVNSRKASRPTGATQQFAIMPDGRKIPMGDSPPSYYTAKNEFERELKKTEAALKEKTAFLRIG